MEPIEINREHMNCPVEKSKDRHTTSAYREPLAANPASDRSQAQTRSKNRPCPSSSVTDDIDDALYEHTNVRGFAGDPIRVSFFQNRLICGSVREFFRWSPSVHSVARTISEESTSRRLGRFDGTDIDYDHLDVAHRGLRIASQSGHVDLAAQYLDSAQGGGGAHSVRGSKW